MSLLAIEGFDHYETGTYQGKLLANDGAIYTSGGRYGAGYWSAGGTGNCTIGLGSNNQEIIVGLGLYLTGTESSAYSDIIAFKAFNGTTQGMLHVGGGNVLYVTRGTSTIIANGSTGLSTETWYYIEIRYKVDDSSGEVEVKINATPEISATSLDTRSSASYNSTYSIILGAGRYGSSRIDDVYVLETGSSPNNTFLGDCRVDTLNVDAAGTHTDWTPLSGSNYQNVDEAQTDDDTTYNTAQTEGDTDTFGHVDLSQTTDVYGMQVSARVSKTDASNMYARLVVRQGGTDYKGDVEGVGASYSFIKQIREVDPNTSTQWTRSGINTAEIGIERTSSLTAAPTTTATTTAPTTTAPTTTAPTTLATTTPP